MSTRQALAQKPSKETKRIDGHTRVPVGHATRRVSRVNMTCQPPRDFQFRTSIQRLLVVGPVGLIFTISRICKGGALPTLGRPTTDLSLISHSGSLLDLRSPGLSDKGLKQKPRRRTDGWHISNSRVFNSKTPSTVTV